MVTERGHRAFKSRVYGQFARIGKALANPHRLELLDLLAQGERPVEVLAGEAGLSLANTSQHLAALRAAGLVQQRKDGHYVYDSLSDPVVFELSRALRRVAERRLAEVDRLVQEHFPDREAAEPVTAEELRSRLRSGSVVVLDTRPAVEYAAGHLPGAISIPVDRLRAELGRLPKGKEYVAYCRGRYCIYADQAVAILLKSGRRARRLREGFPEWKAAGLPVERPVATPAADAAGL